MKPQVITALRQDTSIVYSQRDDAFKFNPERPAKWLQHLCLGILRRLGCFDMTATTQIETHVIKGEDFMEIAIKQWEWLSGELGKNPTSLLIGAEEYDEVMQRKDATTLGFVFNASYRTGYNTWRGLTVHVVPWMRGILVL